jgi:hypothetical protein
MQKKIAIEAIMALALAGCSLFGAGKQDVPSTTATLDPRFAQESPAIAEISSSLQQALKAGNIEAAIDQFAPEVKTAYQKTLIQADTEMRRKLADALAGAQLSSLDSGSVKGDDLSAELTLALDGRTFHVEMVKRDGKWLFNSL